MTTNNTDTEITQLFRYRCKVSYLGSDYYGFQRQSNLPSVAGSIERALKMFTGCDITIHGAGRTDSGVHAMGQMIHFDLPKQYHPDRVMAALNHFLKHDTIAILESQLAPSNFHARMSAKSRAYLYIIKTSPQRSIFDEGRKFIINEPLDLQLMRDGAKLLLQTEDFSSFRAANCQAKSPIRTLSKFTIEEQPGLEYHFNVQARSFLHNQVRIMVGTLYHLGLRKISLADLQTIIEAKSRTATPYTAPAHGLYFMEVEY